MDNQEIKWQLIGLAEEMFREAAKRLPVQPLLAREHAHGVVGYDFTVVIQWETPEFDVLINHKRVTYPYLTGGMQWSEHELEFAKHDGYIDRLADNFAKTFWQHASEKRYGHDDKFTLWYYRETS